MKKLLSYSIVLFVLTIILLLIIPLPAALVDVAIIVNISLSLMILVITMTIHDALEFSIFPSLLLVTTLFRLGINVSTTRNILTNSGSSGQIIQAFGDFILQGNVVVGMVIYLIIVLMQFIVITKGAERVSEVAARFTLDAMPGKQMAIDADLNSGLINEQEAKVRREKIQREADFYGSMDGATKIVKGDSVMSLITTAINLIGGSIIGIIQSGDTIANVLNTYSIFHNQVSRSDTEGGRDCPWCRQSGYRARASAQGSDDRGRIAHQFHILQGGGEPRDLDATG